MSKTTTRVLLWSLVMFYTQLLWSKTEPIYVDSLPPQIIQSKTPGSHANTILLQAKGGDEYLWSTGARSAEISVESPLSPKKYSVHIKRHKTQENWLIQQTVYPNTLRSQQAGCQNVGLSWQSKVCAGSSVTIRASGGIAYKWATGETTSSITVVPSAGAIYTVTITGEGGCEDVQSTARAPIEVIPVPVAQISVSNNECSVIGAILTASGGEAYLWGEGQTTQSIVTEEAVLYKVTVSNGNGWCSDSKSIVVSTNFKPQITGVTELCHGLGTQLSVSGGTSFLWGNGSTNSSIQVSPTTVGQHTYTVQVNAGACSRNISHTITVIPSPSAQITGPNTACYNGSIALSASSAGTYKWSTGATSSSISPSFIQSSQTYTLTVTDPGTQCSSVGQKIVEVLPRPTLNEAPSSVCEGGSISLSVSGGSSYSWNVGGTTASIVHSPSSLTEYRVTVSDANGCSYVLSKIISVNSPPNLTFGGGTSICAGQSLNITALGGATYLWSHNNATTGTITVSPTVNTTYTVTATSSGGCTATAQRVITVKPSPAGAIVGPGSICPGQSVTLTASGGSSYLWSGSNASTASITVNPTQNSNYTVSISNIDGCTVVKSHAIAVNISGKASNDGPLSCTKTSVILSASTDAQGATYRWKNASGVIIATTANHTVNIPGVYNLEISAAGGCTYNTATEVLLDQQAPQVNASNSGVITCTQSSTNLLGSSSLVPTQVEWRNSSSLLIASTLNTIVNQAGVYTLKVTAANGCSSTATTTVSADIAAPQASIQHDGPLTCAKTSVTLSAASSTPNLQYTWRNAAGSIIGSNVSSVVVNAAGTYQLEAKGSNGCVSNTSSTLSQSGNFPNISVSPNATISCIGPETTVSGNSTTPGVSYAWYNPNGRLMSTQKSFITNIGGTYTLKVTSTEGCVSSASTTIDEFVLGGQAITLNVGGTNTNNSFAQGELTCTKNRALLHEYAVGKIG